MAAEKTCSRCGECKPLDGFYLDGGKPRANCKDCHRAAVRQRRADNPEEHRARDRARYPDRRDDQIQYLREWREANPDKANGTRRERYASDRAYADTRRQQVLEYQRRNPELIAERNRRYAAANPDLMRQHQAKRRATKMGVVHEPWSRQEIFKRDKGICRLCGKAVDPKKFEIDHIYPLAMGGPDAPKNLRLTHPECNVRRKKYWLRLKRAA